MTNESYTFTTNRKLPVCPKCGRHGQRSERVDGGQEFVHGGNIVNIGGICMNEITDHCFIASPYGKREAFARTRYEQLLQREYSRDRVKAYWKVAYTEAKTQHRNKVYAELKKRGFKWNPKGNAWERIRATAAPAPAKESRRVRN